MGWSQSLNGSQDGRTLVFAANPFKKVLIVDVHSRQTRLLTFDDNVYDAEILPDGKYLVTHMVEGGTARIGDPRFWSLQTLSEVQLLPRALTDGKFLTFSPDERFVATFDAARRGTRGARRSTGE